MIALLLLSALGLLSDHAYSQTFCSTSQNGRNTTCLGDNNEVTTIQRNGQNRVNDRNNQSFYGDSVIVGAESQSYRDEQRRSEERRRETIYGDRESRSDSRSRSRYDDGR
ncbi:MAG: hypothetical protein ACRCZI_15625 [Cetobacterium sp.]